MRGLPAFLLCAALAAPLVFGLAMTGGLNHDEHQHVAAGALLAREGLLPYIDYPHFHTPYLAFIYAAIFSVTDHLLLGARLFSAACAAGIAGLVGAAAARAFAGHPPRVRRFAIGAAMVLCLSSTVFAETTGRAWNQEPALLFALLGLLLLLAGVRRARCALLAAAGLCLGLAIGIRLTYAPLVAGFAIAIFIAPATRALWLRSQAWLASGLAAGLAGVLCFFAAAPEQAYFGNFEFAKVNVTYRLSTGHPRTMTLPKKLRFMVKEVMRPDAGLVLACGLSLAAAAASARQNRLRLTPQLRCVLWTLPFLLIGSLAPSPAFDQYFYPFVPWLLVAAVLAAASLPMDSPWLRRLGMATAAACILSVGLGADSYTDLEDLITPRKWTPIEQHVDGQKLAHHAPAGPWLTLAPILPLEAGRAIYPSLATGPFAWRVSPFVTAETAAAMKMFTPHTLARVLDANPPGAVFAGQEEEGEELLIDYAESRDYERTPGLDEDLLWFRRGGSPDAATHP